MSVRSAAPLKLATAADRERFAGSHVDLLARRSQEIRRHRLNVQLLRLAFAVFILGGWELGARIGVIDKFFWSQPSEVGATLWRWVRDGTDLGPLWLQAWTTLEETAGGFVVGSILGVVLGIALGRNRLLSEVAAPYIKAANAIPRVVLGAMFAISLGLDIKSKIATASVLVFFVVFFNAFQGVREVDRNLIANARILGADNRRLTTEVIIPSALSWIIASLHTSFGLALVGAVVGELFGATAGVGELIYSAKNNFDMAGVFAGMALLAAMALVAEALITALENRLIRWRPPVATETRI
jgi:NitT/TauT family transport system permease protein